MDLSLFKPFVDLVHESKGTASVIFAAGVGTQHVVRYWWDRRNLKKMNFRSRIEFIGVEPVIENRQRYLEFSTHGKQGNLKSVIELPMLERSIVAATRTAKKSGGLLRLKHGSEHRLMMEQFEEHLTGLDPDANLDAIMGRTLEVDADHVAFCPTFYYEDGDTSIIRVYVVDAELLPQFAKLEFCQQFICRPKRYTYRLEMLCHIAKELDSPHEKSGDTAVIWHTKIKTGRTRTVVDHELATA